MTIPHSTVSDIYVLENPNIKNAEITKSAERQLIQILETYR